MKTMTTVLLCVLMMTASLAIADQVRTDYDRSAPFYKYRTFMWDKYPQTANPWVNEWIVNAVDAELQAKGLCLVESDADLAVSASTPTCDKHQVGFFYAFLAGGWSWYHYWTPAEPSITVVEAFDADTLVVDVYETQTQRVVWWGWGTDTLSKNIKHLNRTVEQMFMGFPPGA